VRSINDLSHEVQPATIMISPQMGNNTWGCFGKYSIFRAFYR